MPAVDQIAETRSKRVVLEARRFRWRILGAAALAYPAIAAGIIGAALLVDAYHASPDSAGGFVTGEGFIGALAPLALALFRPAWITSPVLAVGWAAEGVVIGITVHDSGSPTNDHAVSMAGWLVFFFVIGLVTFWPWRTRTQTAASRTESQP